MATNLEEITRAYFEIVRDLRNGIEGSVEKMMELWGEDGIFEFAGDPPIVGTYKGMLAINTFYKNRFNSNKMKLSVSLKKNEPEDVTLDIVDTEVTDIKVKGNTVTVSRLTAIGTKEGYGFDMQGTHFFEFEDNKIKRLRMITPYEPIQSRLKSLDFNELTIKDIGRLSLAAWAVV